MANFKLFAGTAHPELANELSESLQVPLSASQVVRFENSEVRVTIQEDVKNATCIVLQPTSNPTDENLMELFFFCDALKRQEAKKVIAFIPYFGYARQNIQHQPGEDVSANVVIRFLETVGYDEVYVFDLHDEATAGIFSIPFAHLTTFPLLAAELKKYLKEDAVNEKVTLISPDQSGTERVRKFGEAFFGNDAFELGVVEKKRNPAILHNSEALDLHGEVQGKICILVDDICTSGLTLMNAAELCLERGATRVLAAVAHHDFGEGVAEKLQNSRIEMFFSTNTIPMKKIYEFAKLRVVSIVPTIVEKL